MTFEDATIIFAAPTADDVAAHCKTMVPLNRARMKNDQVNPGGLVGRCTRWAEQFSTGISYQGERK
ncbi:hypothetical protein ASE06_06225 [Sphingopyxis sp. Root214]|nr:hypothetical protein ASD73_01770 [Sphingopyxis sp. Root154]KRC09456.1 hypothetical protein ASE06_06225 [Sphingopyxis sp. Root214]